MTLPPLRIPELGVTIQRHAAGVRLLAAGQLALVFGVLCCAAFFGIDPSYREAATWLMLAASVAVLITTVPAVIGGRFRFALAGIGSIVTTLVVLVLGGMILAWQAQALGWVLLVLSMFTVAYHLVGGRSSRAQ